MRDKIFKRTSLSKKKIVSGMLSTFVIIAALMLAQTAVKADEAGVWKQNDTKWNYLKSDGVKQTGWASINGKWYYLGTKE